MVTPPKDCIEIVLMSNDAAQTHVWLQTNASLARRYVFDREKSLKIIGGLAVLLPLMLYFSPASTIILLLLLLIIVAPLSMVGMIGYSRAS